MEDIQIQFRINGDDMKLMINPLKSLAQLLREELGLTGTKVSCNEGECGSCTVLFNDQAVQACLVPLSQLDGGEVWTIEGLTPLEGLHPLQDAFLQEGAVQCGYCTPGLIITGIALLRKNPSPTEREIKEAISGNLCRCTGYHKIIQAIRSCADQISTSGEIV